MEKGKVKILRIMVILWCCLIVVFYEHRKSHGATRIFRESQQPVLNIGCGLCFTAFHHRPEKGYWFKKYVNISYRRFHWADLEPEDGVDNFKDTIGSFILKWRKQGYRVAFGIMSCSQARQSTPDWVFSKYGVPFVLHHVYSKSSKSHKVIKDPVFWDPIYIKLQKRFIRRLGEYISGGNGVEYIDIRSLGTWGEMHLLGFSSSELRNNNFDFKTYAQCYMDIIDTFVASFPKTILLLNIGGLYEKMLPFSDLARFSASKGVGFRFDGLMVNSLYKGQKVACKIFNTYSTNTNDDVRPVPCLYEFAKKETDPSVIQRCLNISLLNHANYIHLNLGPLDVLPKETRKIIKAASLQVGYRFFVKEIELKNKYIDNNLSGKIHLVLKIKNTGEGMCPFDGIVRVLLVDEDLEKILSRSEAEIKMTRWRPQSEFSCNLVLDIPSLHSGKDYWLKIGVLARERSESLCFLKLANLDANMAGNYLIAAFRLVIKDDGLRIEFLP